MSLSLFEVVACVTEAIISCIYFINFLTCSCKRVICICIWGEITAIVSLFVVPFSIFYFVLINILELIFVLFAYTDKKGVKLKLFALRVVVQLVSISLSYLVYSTLIDKSIEFINIWNNGCGYCLLYLLMYSIIISIAFQIIRKEKAPEFLWSVTTQAIAGIGEISFMLIVIPEKRTQISVICMIAVLSMIATNISIGTVVPIFFNSFSLSHTINLGHELSSLEYKYYETSVENERKIREIKHDISNHIQIIYSLFENGENKKGMEYINELKSRYANVEQIVFCSNPVVNIILCNKKIEAESKNIDTRITVKDDLKELSVSDFDLSTVICNLLDNAIRGCECSEQTSTKLVVEILKKNSYLVLRVLNSCRRDMSIDGEEIIETTKSVTGTQTHGFGMPIIAGIARKYKGDFVVSAQGGLFTATVVMSLKQ